VSRYGDRVFDDSVIEEAGRRPDGCESDLAEQLLHRASDDEAGSVDRETALRRVTAAVQWARQQIEPKERAEDPGSDTADPR